MKTKVILLIVASMLFGGIVSAAGLYGTFEGYQIVRVQSNGKTLAVEDVPAVNLNGRTMVPIYMLKKIGLFVGWDSETETVNVQLPIIDSDGVELADLYRIKMYNRVADTYRLLTVLGESISATSEQFSITFSVINNNYSSPNNIEESLNKSVTYLQKTIDQYNQLLDKVNNLTPNAKDFGLDTSDMQNILNGYYDAIEYYKNSYSYLEDFAVSNRPDDFNNYLENAKHGFDSTLNGRGSSTQRYYYFYDMIQNY